MREHPLKAKGRFILTLLVIFVLPLSMFYVMWRGFEIIDKTEASEMLIQSPDRKLSSFAAVSNWGDTITSQTMEGIVTVVGFFEFPCDSACIAGLQLTADIQHSMNKYKHFRILDFVTNPEGLQSGALYDLQRRIGVELTWHMLIGSEEQAQRLAAEFDASGAEYNSPGSMALFDKAGDYRGTYNLAKDPEVQALVNDIVFLLKQKAPETQAE